MSQGYVLIAAKDTHYLEMAVSAACSLRVNDNKPIALLISGGLRVPRQYVGLFDWIISFDPSAPYDGDFLRRFVLEKYTPFDKAMHIDADCLLIGREIGRFWDKFDGQPLGVAASLITSGKCYRDQTDVDEVVSKGLAPGVYITNWGVFYYENTGDNPVMALGRKLIADHTKGTGAMKLTYFSRPGQLSDEPIWGIALAQHGSPVSSFDPDNMLQVTSPNTADHRFDYAGGQFSALKGGRRNTGQIYHFAAMNPLDGYLEGVKHYRAEMAVPLPAIRTAVGEVVVGEDWAERIKELLPSLFQDGRVAFRFVDPDNGFSL